MRPDLASRAHARTGNFPKEAQLFFSLSLSFYLCLSFVVGKGSSPTCAHASAPPPVPEGLVKRSLANKANIANLLEQLAT